MMLESSSSPEYRSSVVLGMTVALMAYKHKHLGISNESLMPLVLRAHLSH
jgi:hypothetical protein